MPPSTPLDGYAFTAIGPEALAVWDHFREQLMHEPARGDADAWRTEAARALVRFQETPEPAVEACPTP